MPAILEYIPYRKNDNTSVADEGRHAYFASHGYACVRVDMRGTRRFRRASCWTSTCQQEQDDAVEVIAWLAAQPWCTGSVGMIGISWGGFNGLQIAARRPPALKAIITLCSTDDRYADDMHYMGGCLLDDNMILGGDDSRLLALPPDPRRGRRAVGGRCGCERLETLTLVDRAVARATSAATTFGGTARCARITPTSPAPSTPSAAGPTAIATRCRACWRA